ncbi:MAG: hypothetical protein JO314_12495, partial [Acidobacteria bacterium]|nr:hypothetical protein [Acidobacteriota bacterium]
MFRNRVLRVVILASLTIISFASAALAQDKLTVKDILDRHLQSFGTADAIAKSQNRMAMGRADFTVMMTAKKATGKAVLASDGKDLALFSTFDLLDYRMERIGLFDNKVTIPVVDQGHRSPLGSFLLAYNKFLGERLFGGSIFSTWPLYGSDLGKLNVEVDKKVKIGDKEAWVLKVTPKGGLGTGSYIKLYFDAKDFHHIRTVYRQHETERGFFDPGSKDTNKGQVPGGFDQDMANNGSTLTEDFDDFSNDAAGISLPHKYSVLLSIDSVRGLQDFRWEFQISEYKLIKEFPANFFSFQA